MEENQLSATTHGDKSGSTIAAKIASTKANIGEKTTDFSNDDDGKKELFQVDPVDANVHDKKKKGFWCWCKRIYVGRR